MKNRIIEIIQSIRPELEFHANEDVILFGVLDSLDIILLVNELEAKLDITISSENIVPENFHSLHSLEAFLRTLS